MPREPMKDVIVLLPGITGSVLRKDGKDVWALSGGAALRALVSLGRNIQALALTEDPPDVDDLGDGVTAPAVMPDVHLIPGLWKIDGYSKIARTVREQFDVTPGRNFFEFPYDWRRDNRVAARRLATQGRDWLKRWREESGNADAKLILVGHSMGGLVSRYFLECLDGWRDTRMLVTFGTPYRGSVNAVGFLANGMEKKLGPITLIDLSALLRSFTSVYQLLPVYPCYDAGDGSLARVAEAAVPNVDQSKAAAALAFHREIEAAVEAHRRDDADYVERGYSLHPVVGTFQPTAQSARERGDGVELLRSYRGDDMGGDGTVPRVSATPIEMGDDPAAMFAAERHASLQNFDPVLTQLHGVLSGLGISLGGFRELAVRVGVDIDDAYSASEQVVVRARPEMEGTALEATVGEAESGREVARSPLSGDGEWLEARLGPMAAGTYRVTVTGQGLVTPVTDVFTVFDET